MTYIPKESKEHKGWYEIPGYAACCANRKGEILTKKTGHVSKGGNAGRYLKVSAYKDGAKVPSLVYVHDLVCRAFHGVPKAGQVVNHKDDRRDNNKPSNLEWNTQSQNIKDTYKRGLRKPTTSKETYQEGISTFTHDGKGYDLNGIFKLIANRTTIDVKLKDLEWNLKHAKVSESRVRNANPEYPIIIVTDDRFNRPTGYVVIDGTHRLVKAKRIGLSTVAAYLLTLDEIEPYRITVGHEEFQSMELYHIDPAPDLAGMWKPQLPDTPVEWKGRFSVPNTAHISVNPTIEGCVLTQYIKIAELFQLKSQAELEFYVYKPVLKGEERIIPSETLTADRWVWNAHVTKEHWILDPVEFECVGKIRLTNVNYISTQVTPPYNDRAIRPIALGPRTIEWSYVARSEPSVSMEALPVWHSEW